MIAEFTQTSQNPFLATFELRVGGAVTGVARFEGQLGSRDGLWYLETDQSVWNMGRIANPPTEKKAFRTYSIQRNGMPAGVVYSATEKTGLFRCYQFHRMLFGVTNYELYPIGFGKEGAKCPIYQGTQQIALLEKPATVYNGLHRFSIFSQDEQAQNIAMLFCAYSYILGCYRPGEKVVQGVKTTYTISTNKVLKSKYDSEFKKSIL